MAEGPWQRAWAVALSGRVPSHSTAAAIWGYAVADESCHGIVDHGGGPSRRLIDHRLPLPGSEVLRIAGLPITSERRTQIDLPCGQRVEASLGTVTDGLRRGLLEPVDLLAIAQEAKGRIGARRARGIAESCAGNPWASVLEWRFQKMARSISGGWRFSVDVSDGLVRDRPRRCRPRAPGSSLNSTARGTTALSDSSTTAHGTSAWSPWGMSSCGSPGADLEERPDEVVAIIRRTMAQRLRRAS